MTQNGPNQLPQQPARRRYRGSSSSIDGVDMYRISDFDQMPPFLMSIVSDSTIGCTVSTSGGSPPVESTRIGPSSPTRLMTACTVPAAQPDPSHCCGSIASDGSSLWEPFTDEPAQHRPSRNLYKSLVGDTVVFEETREDLGLTFRYRWSTLGPSTDSSEPQPVINEHASDASPSKCSTATQHHAGKRTAAVAAVEQHPGRGLSTQRGRPGNSDGHLRPRSSRSATAPNRPSLCTPTSPGHSVFQIQRSFSPPVKSPTFGPGAASESESLTKGTRAGYLLNANSRSRRQRHKFVAHRRQTSTRPSSTFRADAPSCLTMPISVDSIACRHRTWLRPGSAVSIATADGDQCTNDDLATTHHFANTLFNCMRGGVFVSQRFRPGRRPLALSRAPQPPVHRTHADPGWRPSASSIDRRELLARCGRTERPGPRTSLP